MTRYRHFITGFLFVSGMAGFFSLPSHAHAEAGLLLTSDNVREFIEKTAVIASGKETEMSSEEIDEYLNAHIHPQARFKSTMRFSIPGFDMQETTMNLNKDGFIEDVHKAADSVSDYESQIEISNVLISKDGRKATLQTQSMESGTMPVADHIEQEEVPVQGMSTCTQTLMIGDNDMIQMYNATCTTNVEFQTFDP